MQCARALASRPSVVESASRRYVGAEGAAEASFGGGVATTSSLKDPAAKPMRAGMRVAGGTLHWGGKAAVHGARGVHYRPG